MANNFHAETCKYRKEQPKFHETFTRIHTFFMRRNNLLLTSNLFKLEGSPLRIIRRPPNEAYITLKPKSEQETMK